MYCSCNDNYNNLLTITRWFEATHGTTEDLKQSLVSLYCLPPPLYCRDHISRASAAVGARGILSASIAAKDHSRRRPAKLYSEEDTGFFLCEQRRASWASPRTPHVVTDD